jgi:dTDP-4-dehydrorhamnose reductase
VLANHPGALVVRTSAFFGPWDGHNFVTQALDALERGDPFVAASDLTVSPTFVPDLVHACLDLAVDREAGIWHLANQGQVTWAELARRAADLAGIDTSRLEAKPAEEFGFTAPRPRYCALASERGALLPALDDALRRYVDLRNADRDERRELEAEAERRQQVAGGDSQIEVDEALQLGT